MDRAFFYADFPGIYSTNQYGYVVPGSSNGSFDLARDRDLAVLIIHFDNLAAVRFGWEVLEVDLAFLYTIFT